MIAEFPSVTRKWSIDEMNEYKHFCRRSPLIVYRGVVVFVIADETVDPR